VARNSEAWLLSTVLLWVALLPPVASAPTPKRIAVLPITNTAGLPAEQRLFLTQVGGSGSIVMEPDAPKAITSNFDSFRSSYVG
jgi:hypothetical protein